MPFTYTTVDRLITELPAKLHTVVLLASSAGGDVTVYDGRDVISGTSLGPFKGAANISLPIAFDPPLECDQGIYVDVGSNVTGVLIHWSIAR